MIGDSRNLLYSRVEGSQRRVVEIRLFLANAPIQLHTSLSIALFLNEVHVATTHRFETLSLGQYNTPGKLRVLFSRRKALLVI